MFYIPIYHNRYEKGVYGHVNNKYVLTPRVTIQMYNLDLYMTSCVAMFENTFIESPKLLHL